MGRKNFFIVIQNSSGEKEKHPMKNWLQNHPNVLPKGADPRNYNSHKLRDDLRKLGWKMEE